MKLNEKGMSLVELLAAITILGIVIVTSMSLFPQITKFNMKTENKLETMNEARIKLEQVKENPQMLCSSHKVENNGIITFSQEYGDYKYEIEYYLKDILSNKKVDICKTPKQTTPVIRLNQVHIKVFDDDKLTSEIFGYVKY